MSTPASLNRLSVITKSALPIALPDLPSLAERARSGVLKAENAADFDKAMKRWLEGVTNVLRFNNSLQEINAALKKIEAVKVDLGATDSVVAELRALIAETQTNLGDYVEVAGSVMTGFLTLSGAPTLPFHAANKHYVDALVSLASGYLHVQTSPANPWVITHSLGRIPSVMLLNDDGYKMEADIVPTTTNVTVEFNGSRTGKAVLV